ncbi:thiamine-phosphate kinase [Halomonas halocynthiae]|uniref:thiamine-phosphate kinase n=1 Tax=Halomonas halocynthiae TaxID=176290 RepID=UPI0003F55671|nr:thiamine-phosphate kinase [Halomonas halocynthiae]
MLGEFDLIRRYLAPESQSSAEGIVLGPGDDAALLMPSPGQQLVVSVDTSVAGVHFPPDAPAQAIGHRALAVSLSDLAAMGATPRWCLMSLTLPHADADWVASFASGFHALCQASGIHLVGGDVTHGELAIGVTVMGEVAVGEEMRRSAAQAGDLIAVTGALGGGAGGLSAWQAGNRNLDSPLLARYLLPQPRIAAGLALRGLATAAIDVSDGLSADLRHLCDASCVGAELDISSMPLADGLVETLGESAACQAALGGGDDYELLLGLPPSALNVARQRLDALALELTVIGRFTSTLGVTGVDPEWLTGWQHFSGDKP